MRPLFMQTIVTKLSMVGIHPNFTIGYNLFKLDICERIILWISYKLKLHISMTCRWKKILLWFQKDGATIHSTMRATIFLRMDWKEFPIPMAS